jgi:hypothetical protein
MWSIQVREEEKEGGGESYLQHVVDTSEDEFLDSGGLAPHNDGLEGAKERLCGTPHNNTHTQHTVGEEHGRRRTR